MMLKGIFVEIFSKLPDPRIERTKKHLFLDLIGLALFAVLGGAQCYTETEDFCCHHERGLQLDPRELRSSDKKIWSHLQRGKALKNYEY